MTLEIKKYLRKKTKSNTSLVGVSKSHAPKDATPERDGL
jgi:hypothetical protein